MLIESDFPPLRPHYMGFIEVKLDDALGILLVSLNMMPPKSLLHETLDQVVIVANADLVLVEGRHLP